MADPEPSALDAMFHPAGKSSGLADAIAKNITLVIGILAAIVPITEGIRAWYQLKLSDANQKHQMEIGAANQEQQVEIEFLKLVIGKDIPGDDRRRVLEVLKSAPQQTPLSMWAAKEAQLYDDSVQKHQEQSSKYEADIHTTANPMDAQVRDAENKLTMKLDDIQEANNRRDFDTAHKLQLELLPLELDLRYKQKIRDQAQNTVTVTSTVTVTLPQPHAGAGNSQQHVAAPPHQAPPPQNTDAGESGEFTVSIVTQMFPGTPRANIEKNLPDVLSALKEFGVADRAMTLMALGTIRAETASFLPIPEGQNKYNTAPGGIPFGLYDPDTRVGKALGNTQPGDGAKFKARGYLQMAGRDIYTRIGQGIGVPLTDNPDLASDSKVAARILAYFLKGHEPRIRAALAQGDLAMARRLVNGGSLGLVEFTDAYNTGEKLTAGK